MNTARIYNCTSTLDYILILQRQYVYPNDTSHFLEVIVVFYNYFYGSNYFCDLELTHEKRTFLLYLDK